jgi:hypothetical protein
MYKGGTPAKIAAPLKKLEGICLFKIDWLICQPLI